ncbi:MAG: PQQ-dependent sugar dehydrogenase [Chloroflexi bacterium]|nr:PQQ-dependent sugar dehydrogenase [Chloroflexota bacterium]MDA1147624.1 PQQ-dependent sugar dehydrogenase [Chloroflexota bacterium]
MRPGIIVLVGLGLLLAACSGKGDAATPSPGATTPASDPDGTALVSFVQGLSPADYYQASCAACHGVDKEGAVGPPLVVERLTEPAEVYFDAIKNGRPGTAMPAWGAVGLSDAEVRTLVAYLQGRDLVGGSGSGIGSQPSVLGIEAKYQIELPPIARTASRPLEWTVTNSSDAAVELIQFDSSTLSVFLLDPLPIRLAPGQSRDLRLVFVPNPRGSEGDPATGTASVLVRGSDAVTERVQLAIRSAIGAAATPLRLSSMGLPDYPSRVATWQDYVYVGYLGGLIEVYQWTGNGGLELVESVSTIAETPNHGPHGRPNPDAAGRLIGGFALDADGTLYVTHSDPRLNEGEFLKTGHLADLNSGAVTALDGPPGQYGAAGHRRDLVAGLPRNVTNHMPLGLALQGEWLYVGVGAMTDSGQTDESKPQPDTDISGAVLRINVADPSRFPLVLAEPGGPFASAAVLEPGLLEVFATGMRNAFGLAFGPDGQLYLSDQSSDGGATPQPAGDDGPPGLIQNLGPDHLHLVRRGDFLGQPNLARGESILNDGSEYITPIPNPDYAAPIHVFGTHNSATGIAWYEGAAFPDLRGKLLVSKFSGATGLQALTVEDGRVVAVQVLATKPLLSNVTDVAVGPNGELVIAEFWEKRLRIARGYAPPSPAVSSDHFYFGINLDPEDDSADGYALRTGVEPEVLVDFFRFPLDGEGRSRLVDFLETTRSRQSIALVTLEPFDGLGAVTPTAVDELAAIVAASPGGGATVMIRFAHEMNGSWYPWSQQPEAYIAAFRLVAETVYDEAPGTTMLWAPNYGGGYPFRGGAFEATVRQPGFALLDSNGDGQLDTTDDPYAPYYPGDDVVDWVGMSLYHWGSAYPWRENEVPEAGKFIAELRGEYSGANGDDSAIPDFYGEYAERRGKPLAIPETAALYNTTLPGDEAAIKSDWWSQVFSQETREQLPALRMVNWFEHLKPEAEVGGNIIDWRATGDPSLAEAFVAHLRAWLASRLSE